MELFNFDLQMFGKDGDAAGSGDSGSDEGVKFSGKFKEMVDPVSQSKIKIPVELETFFGHAISSTRNSVKAEVEAKFKPTLEALEKEAGEGSQAKAELEKLKLESMTAEERAQANAKKVIFEHEKKATIAIEEANTWKSRFERSTIKNDIMSSFGDVKLCNPGQTAVLFEHEGQAKISEIVDADGKPTGQFEARVALMLEDKNGKQERVEGSASELFKRWIQLERNSHHIMNTMAPGSGSRSGGGNRTGKSQDAIMKMTPVERMREARKQG
jgi:hypothetical protein